MLVQSTFSIKDSLSEKAYFVTDELSISEHLTLLRWLGEQVLYNTEKALLHNDVLGVLDAFEVLDELVTEVVLQDLESVCVLLWRRHFISLNLIQ